MDPIPKAASGTKALPLYVKRRMEGGGLFLNLL